MKREDIGFETMPPKHPVITTRPLGFRPKLRYQKIGKGSLHIWGAIIKPNQEVLVYPEDIPAEHAHLFECLDGIEMQDAARSENEQFIEKENLYIISGSDVDGYSVINSKTEKALTEELLSKEDAEKLRNSLNT